MGKHARYHISPSAIWSRWGNAIVVRQSDQETAIHLPIIVKHITEIWANEGKDKFLVGIILSDSTGEALSICTESDEIELLGFDSPPHRIKWTMRFYYQHIEYNNYSQKRSKRRPLVDTMPKNSQWARPPAVARP